MEGNAGRGKREVGKERGGGGRYVTCRVVHRFCFSLEEEGQHGRQSPHHLSPSVNQVPQSCASCKTLSVYVGGDNGGNYNGI